MCIYKCFSYKILRIPENPAEQHPFKKLTAGAIAGIVSVATTYPMDLVRYEYQIFYFRLENDEKI